eukprot:CAMPEP_0114511550 /NCGR_PEP_ID=MMETSP0109-20121206/14461_1 /TAXON_ID=29199 /ORGANISM="Chlorarachnion reptans, Strain CCCM449" /LENGTH=394 /DNA_ID=CAMNT_0001691093 /DNA_START=182 /DNA_END=1366 /DNA_ORIENTATION=+
MATESDLTFPLDKENCRTDSDGDIYRLDSNEDVSAQKGKTNGALKTKTAKKNSSTMWDSVSFCLYVLGVWISFLVLGWTQEALGGVGEERADGKKTGFKYTHTLVLLQSLGNMAVAVVFILLESMWKGKPLTLNAGVNVRHWIVAALGYQGAHFFGLLSLQYVTFPVQIVCKSCKTIPVLIGEVLIAGERASLKKFVSVFILSIGVILFLFFKPSKKFKGSDEFEMTPEFLFGLMMILLALICDGVYGPYQNYIRDNYHLCGAFHLMFNMNLWQGIFSSIWCLIDGEFAEAYSFLLKYPEALRLLINYCASMALGSCFIYLLQRRCGALVVTKTTTVRKLFSVLVSAYYFGHTISPVQWVGVLVVFTSKLSAPAVTNLIKGLVGPRMSDSKKTQ